MPTETSWIRGYVYQHPMQGANPCRAIQRKERRMYKEAVAVLIPNVETAYDKAFIEYLVKQLSQGLSDKLITILDKEDEVIVKQSKVMVSEYPPTDSIEYRRQIEWSPFVRCKDCAHNPACSDDDLCPFVDTDGHVKEFPNDDFFCKYGERR